MSAVTHQKSRGDSTIKSMDVSYAVRSPKNVLESLT